MSWYFDVLKKYAVFSGRARRREYWFFVLFNIIFSLVATLIDSIIGTGSFESGGGILSLIYTIAMILPSLSVAVRRLHDTGRSGWWLLIVLVPIIGAIVLLVFFCQNSEAGDNQHGPNPKGQLDPNPQMTSY